MCNNHRHYVILALFAPWLGLIMSTVILRQAVLDAACWECCRLLPPYVCVHMFIGAGRGLLCKLGLPGGVETKQDALIPP